MKVHLMYRDRDFTVRDDLPPEAGTLTRDLELTTLFKAMADGDEFLLRVVRQAILNAVNNDPDTILYRQNILRDSLRNYAVVKSLYDLAVDATDNKKRHWLGIFSRYPGGVLCDAMELLQMLIVILGQLRRLAEQHSARFESEGFQTLFKQIKVELTDEYISLVKTRLRELKFPNGILISAQLGPENQGTNHTLRQATEVRPPWFKRMLSHRQRGYSFRIDPRDEAGFQALSDLRDRGINSVANVLAQSADHILDFFNMLRTELAFYLGCWNLHHNLKVQDVPICFPIPFTVGTAIRSLVGLRDVGLILSSRPPVIANDLPGDGKELVMITGANQGGKSTFLRSFGLGQLMMQAGMFVTAELFRAEVCRGLFTHYRREEDATMTSGKLDEELDRISDIVDRLVPYSIVLFNESFAATNEREGSEIASQVVRALLEAHVRVFFVTHQYEFANGFWEEKMENSLFLRAERQTDGARPFKLISGPPRPTSYGLDVYAQIFADESIRRSPIVLGATAPAAVGASDGNP
ncbi:MAG: DNA mismatch repair protein MutS [Planctomycetia bacterium]|nr:DNA mismatch repair protein MutS [Planctomycetia bacterium]